MPARALARPDGVARTGARLPRPSSARPLIRIEDHADFARGIARKVADEYHFGWKSEEVQDLESTAVLVLVERLPRFDPVKARAAAKARGIAYTPGGAFRGFCDEELWSRCRREAIRLRNGGTFHTARPEFARQVKVGALPRCGNCADVAAPALAATPRAWWSDEADDSLSLEAHTIYDTTPDE